MAEVQAQALYTFEGDTTSGELSFNEGETLTIVQQDVGDGWWEARNYLGNVGLIPQAYVEIIEPPEPSFPPPPPPMPTAPPPSSQNGWGNGGGGLEPQQSVDTWDEDDWDDDDDDHSSTSTGGASSSYTNNQTELQGQGNFGLSQGGRPKSSTSPPSDMSKYGTVKKSFNRFSQFAKAGGEAFMMGSFQSNNVSEADMITIIETPDGFEWQPNTQPYTCSVRSPKKESKLKGLKSYIAYQITPSFSNIQVSRRYKHFDWLHIQLENKFTCVPIPPLPDKAISGAIAALNPTSSSKAGRYEDEFIDTRMKLLQLWIDRICRHPVLSQSEVFLHFLTCTDEKKWKQGKRKAEKDEYTGGKFFLTLKTPPTALQSGEIEAKMENFCKFQKNMEDNVKTLSAVAYDNRKKHLGPFKREYQKLGTAFKALAQTFHMDDSSYSKPLTGAIDYVGDTYNNIGDLFEKQPKNDLEPLMDILNEYRGTLGQFPDVLKVHEGAIGKAKECVKQQGEGKMLESVVGTVTQRADIISFGTMAEINHFQHSRCEDFKATMKTFLTGQIKFYQEIANNLQTALDHVEQS
ncbi:sorting nexin lst-4-like isoform X2 [Ruditapes philippinarum]|uniref:sorting nexin lst-4-like isoform X2 n=1 Tax=Ruditapes philippinarum TaxID=129788 RepID=UPI00295A804B|nr:sorting nexin lst-4-like isoform X2 [Ruditapes philippinarum]